MKRIFFLVVFFVYTGIAQAEIYSLNNNHKQIYETQETLLEMLQFAENQLFDKTYKKNSITQRLERLELALYGAIQDGIEAQRIYNLKKSLTNVASGGYGLQYNMPNFNLSQNQSGGSFWSFGNSTFGYNNPYNNCRYNNFWSPYKHKSHYHKHHSHRLPPPHLRGSHRVGSPYYHNNNPIVNGDFSKNYSMGTSVRILND